MTASLSCTFWQVGWVRAYSRFCVFGILGPFSVFGGFSQRPFNQVPKTLPMTTHLFPFCFGAAGIVTCAPRRHTGLDNPTEILLWPHHCHHPSCPPTIRFSRFNPKISETVAPLRKKCHSTPFLIFPHVLMCASCWCDKHACWKRSTQIKHTPKRARWGGC